MATRARTSGKVPSACDTSMPSSMMVPESWRTSPLTHCTRVDLPEPEAPQTTTRSPVATSRSTPSSATTAR